MIVVTYLLRQSITLYTIWGGLEQNLGVGGGVEPLSPIASAATAATYRFRGIRGQMDKMSDLGIPEGTAPKRGEDLSATDMYHHAKFHADRCHRRRDICSLTEKNTATNIRFYTNV